MKDLWQDVRYAIRVLLRNTSFSAIVVGTLALGIGPNIAIFYFLHEVLLRPPPRVAQPDRLVQLRRWGPARDSEGFSHEGYKEYRDHATVFSGLLAVRGVELNLSDHGRPERIGGDPRLVGRTVVLNGFRYTVLGIAPRNSAGSSLAPRWATQGRR